MAAPTRATAGEGARERVDVVVVGGGSAGCVVANRLSADPSRSVLVLEAGPPVRWYDLPVHMPMAMSRAVGSARYDYRYTSEEEPELLRRRIRHPRGRVLGGSSAINGMLYQRGHATDFDDWARVTGDRGWDYAHLAPYFARVEAAVAPQAGPTRGRGGAHVLTPDPASSALHEALFEAGRQAGHPLASDPNEVQDGLAPFEKAQARGRRVTAAGAYLAPVAGRRNLRVVTGAQVSRVLFEGRRAVGVAYRLAGGPEQVVRAGEVVLSGGTFATPQLLQLSGVGPAAALSALGIEVVADLPGVGQDLQDHLGAFVQHRSRLPVPTASVRQQRAWPGIAARWLALGSGAGASTHIEAGGFLRTSPDLLAPDATVFFSTLVWPVEGMPQVVGHGYQLYAYPGRVESRGRVALASADPAAPPSLRFDYLSTETDRRNFVRVLRTVRELLSQPAFERFDGGEVVPGPGVRSDAELLAFVRRTARTGLHPTSSCRMGTDDMAVVDPATMRVHGVEGLRVVDASAIPVLPNGNSYAPVMALAERGADLVAGRAPLAPVVVPAAALGRPGGAPSTQLRPASAPRPEGTARGLASA